MHDPGTWLSNDLPKGEDFFGRPVTPAHFFEDGKSKRIVPISVALSPILSVISDSQSILRLPPDWDGDGAPAFSEATLSRAVEFLFGHASFIWDKYSLVIRAPRILPVPDGSIDLHWKHDGKELLINVPPTPARLAYYGDSQSSGQTMKGVLADEVDRGTHHMLMWLTTA